MGKMFYGYEDEYEDEEIMSVAVLMRKLHIGKNTAYHLLKSGQILHFQIGNIYKIPRKGFDEYISRQCEQTIEKNARQT
jgi:excisionase family DNA binding protein